jgi:hypothetical protein
MFVRFNPRRKRRKIHEIFPSENPLQITHSTAYLRNSLFSQYPGHENPVDEGKTVSGVVDMMQISLCSPRSLSPQKTAAKRRRRKVLQGIFVMPY